MLVEQTLHGPILSCLLQHQFLLTYRWLVDPDLTSRRKETFHELNLHACCHGSNSNFSATSLSKELSSATDRVSDRAACVWGVESARSPSSIPPGGVAQGGLLIPVSSSDLGVVGGGVEQNGGNGSGMLSSGLWNMLWDGMTLRRRADTQHVPIMSWATRTHVRVKRAMKCGTQTRQKNVRATMCSVFTPRRLQGNRYCL